MALLYCHPSDILQLTPFVKIEQEQENREMLERFRSAHMDTEERELKLQQAEGLNNSIRLELLSSDTERRHLREKVSLQDREIHEVK